LFRGYLGLLFLGVVSLGFLRVGLGLVWGKLQTFYIVFLKGLLRVGLGCMYIMHIGVYLGLRSTKAENSREAEQWRSKEAKKHKGRSREKQKAELRQKCFIHSNM